MKMAPNNALSEAEYPYLLVIVDTIAPRAAYTPVKHEKLSAKITYDGFFMIVMNSLQNFKGISFLLADSLIN